MGEDPSDCITFGGLFAFTGNPCAFEGVGFMDGVDQDSDPVQAGYQAHLEWAPIDGCAQVSGQVWFAPGWTNPQVGTPPTGSS